MHSSPIAKVKWDSEQDYLFIQCSDGSVSIWEVRTIQINDEITIGTVDTCFTLSLVGAKIFRLALVNRKAEYSEQMHMTS